MMRLHFVQTLKSLDKNNRIYACEESQLRNEMGTDGEAAHLIQSAMVPTDHVVRKLALLPVQLKQL